MNAPTTEQNKKAPTARQVSFEPTDVNTTTEPTDPEETATTEPVADTIRKRKPTQTTGNYFDNSKHIELLQASDMNSVDYHPRIAFISTTTVSFVFTSTINAHCRTRATHDYFLV